LQVANRQVALAQISQPSIPEIRTCYFSDLYIVNGQTLEIAQVLIDSWARQQIMAGATQLSDEREGMCQAPVAHTCNPSYSGGRDQENRSSKPDCANSS
jgi:hypothetical protein